MFTYLRPVRTVAVSAVASSAFFVAPALAQDSRETLSINALLDITYTDAAGQQASGTINIDTTVADMLIRIRRRPDLLTGEWDAIIEEQIVVLETNPLHQAAATQGDNPLYGSQDIAFAFNSFSGTFNDTVGQEDLTAELDFTVFGFDAEGQSFALFGAVLGLNNGKKKETVSLGALLEEDEAATLSMGRARLATIATDDLGQPLFDGSVRLDGFELTVRNVPTAPTAGLLAMGSIAAMRRRRP